MTLGFTPSIELYGANAARLNERLISWTHIDAAGIESDQLTLTLDIEGLEGLPELGGKSGCGWVIWSRDWWIVASSSSPGARPTCFRRA